MLPNLKARVESAAAAEDPLRRDCLSAQIAERLSIQREDVPAVEKPLHRVSRSAQTAEEKFKAAPHIEVCGAGVRFFVRLCKKICSLADARRGFLARLDGA